MREYSMLAAMVAAGLSGAASRPAVANSNLNDIETVVVIYAENRSFDNLYGAFPGANGLANATAASFVQHNRDGSVMAGLPAVWGGTLGSSGPVVTSAGITAGSPVAPIPISETQSATFLNTFNHPFNVESLYGSESDSDTAPLQYTNRDLYHRFYENQMQIDGGKNDKFAAWADSGGLTMGYFVRKPGDLPLWSWAKDYVLADNFFQSAFGGSYLNHQFLICSCAPIYPSSGGAPVNPAAGGTAPVPSAVNADGVTLTTAATSPASAIDGPPVYVNSSTLTPGPVFYSINTMQPPYPPSGNAVTSTPPQQSVNLASASTMPPQTQTTIGDLLDAAGVQWAWYAGALSYALTTAPNVNQGTTNVPNFQYHHNPFDYFVKFDPVANPTYRAEHLRDGGLSGVNFINDIDAGVLPSVTFYKPQGNLNEHSGYTDVTDGDEHIAELLTHLKNSPQFKHMLVVVTYDENGGWWDHVPPPKGDRFGPGSRIPAIIVSPYANKGTVDHTQYDTTSILRFITAKFNLPVLPGITARDTALVANGFPAMGNLTQALTLP